VNECKPLVHGIHPAAFAADPRAAAVFGAPVAGHNRALLATS
jgi:hypothetical protein